MSPPVDARGSGTAAATPVASLPGQLIGPEGIDISDRPRRQLLHMASARMLGLLLALVVLGVVCLLSLALGSRPMSVGEVFAALRQGGGTVNSDILFGIRLPRTVVGLLVGAALGMAGAVMQGITRNPLADPGILGVNAGAALGVVTAIYVFGITVFSLYVWFAFVGAGAAAVLVYLLGSTGRGGATPVKLALAGAALTAFLASLTTTLLLLDLQTLNVYRFWAVGSLAGRSMDIVGQMLPFMLVGAVLALASARPLNALSMGEDVATSLGQNVLRARIMAACAVTILAGVSTAVAGPIGFIGLTVPHLARAITGPDYRWVLPYSAVLAPILLLAADVLGRVLDRPGEVQVGILTAVLGTPFFIALIRRRKLAQL